MNACGRKDNVMVGMSQEVIRGHGKLGLGLSYFYCHHCSTTSIKWSTIYKVVLCLAATADAPSMDHPPSHLDENFVRFISVIAEA